MKKFVLICIFLTGCSISTSGILSCHYKRGKSRLLDSDFRNSPRTNYHTIVCTNLSSSFGISHYRGFNSKDVVTLIVVNSTIPALPSNSSFSRISQLGRLILNHLGIEEISPGAFGDLPTLKILQLSSNNLTKISKGVFNNLHALKALDLSKNLLRAIEEDSFSSLKNLTILMLNQNRLTVLHQHFTKGLTLDVLDVSGNPLEEVQKFGTNHVGHLIARNFSLKNFDVNLTNTETYSIDLPGGQLEKVDFALFGWLLTFGGSSNRIVTVQNWNKMNGFSFSLAKNQITEAEIGEDVEILNLSHNQIRHLKCTSNQTKKIEILDLSFNEISKLDSGMFLGMVNLHTLSLRNNQISVLHANTFPNCSALNRLNLSYNKIEIVEPDAFNGVSAFASVNLAHNQLKVLTPASLAGLDREAYVDLSDNGINGTDLNELRTFFDFIAV